MARQIGSPPLATPNDRTGNWRVAWKSLDNKERVKRYQRALVALSNGVLKTHPGTFDEDNKLSSGWSSKRGLTGSLTVGANTPQPLS